MISNRDPQRAELEEAKKEIKGALNQMQKKDEIRTGKLEKLANKINEMDNKAKGERKNLEEKLRHVEEGLFEWQ